jgi:hypothetical protein
MDPQQSSALSGEVIVQFIAFLADARVMFWQTHQFAEQRPVFREILTSLDPFKGEEVGYADGGVTVSIALSAELRQPNDLHGCAIGMSLLIRRSAGAWITEAEVGWTRIDVGWDPFASMDLRSTSVEQMMAAAPTQIAWMDAVFREAVTQLQK